MLLLCMKNTNCKQIFEGKNFALYDYDGENGNHSIVLGYGSVHVFIDDEDFEELIQGISFVRSKSNQPRGDFYR